MSQLGLNRKLSAFKRNKRTIIKKIVDNSGDFFQNTNFKNEAFTDTRRKRWKKLKRPRPDGSTRPILQDTGKLRRSRRDKIIGNTRGRVMFTAKYASFHNNGTGKLAKRQFSGESKILNRQNEKLLLNYTSKYLR
jgi:phage gpG-like protein